ncbi:MAG: efflux RND transporter permease subunit, partial [Bdellovibrionia bacterium]
YTKILRLSLRHKGSIIIVALSIFGLSLLTASTIRKEFLPAEDQSQFLVRIKTPRGSSLETTSKTFRIIEDWLNSRPEISGTFAIIGGLTGGQVNTGLIFTNMKPKGKRGEDPTLKHEISQGEFMALTRKRLNSIPGVRPVVQDLSARGFSSSRGFPIEFTIQGPNWQQLVKETNRITDDLKKTGTVTDVDMDYEGETPEIAIIPDRSAAERQGIPISSIADTISTAISGLRIAKYTSEGRRYDVRVKEIDPPNSSELSPTERLEKLYVRNNRGQIVPILGAVKVEERLAPINLTRLNRQRAITVFANVAAGQSQQKVLERVLQFGKTHLSPGYSIQLSGTAQTFQESFQSLLFAIVLGLAVAYMILATQFNSFTDPVTVMMALPFSLTGAFFALLLTHQSLNLYSMIGLILLMGIAKKNSILLIDFTNQVRDESKTSIQESLIKACPVRLRPILMTSIAQVVGALPAALAFGPGAESRKPMAIVVIGGVILSTALTLLVIPCVYSFLTPKERKHSDVDRILREEQSLSTKASG